MMLPSGSCQKESQMMHQESTFAWAKPFSTAPTGSLWGGSKLLGNFKCEATEIFLSFKSEASEELQVQFYNKRYTAPLFGSFHNVVVSFGPLYSWCWTDSARSFLGEDMLSPCPEEMGKRFLQYWALCSESQAGGLISILCQYTVAVHLHISNMSLAHR